jgi:two-component system, NarL family, response regulator DesR
MVTVLLAQGSSLFRSALAHLIDAEADLEVVGAVAESADVPRCIERHRPDVVLLEGTLPGADVLINSLYETLDGTRLLVLLPGDRNGLLGRALPRWAPRVGFVSTDIASDTLLDAIRRTARGEPFVDPQLAVAALAARDNPLTEREREVLKLAAYGEPNVQIARKLFISPGTVRNYLSRATTKTGGRTKVEAIRIAQEAGWL